MRLIFVIHIEFEVISVMVIVLWIISGQTPCATGGMCYLSNDTCDGRYECKDQSDERDCRSGNLIMSSVIRAPHVSTGSFTLGTPSPKVIKLFPSSTWLSMKFKLLINAEITKFC